MVKQTDPMPTEHGGPGKLDLLAQVARQLLVSAPPDQVVAAVFKTIAAGVGLEVCLCYLLEGPEGRLHLVAHAGVPADVAAQCEWLDLNGSLGGSVAQRENPVVVENVQLSADPAVAHLKELGLTAYACFPLLSNQGVIGSLAFGARQRNRFGRQELTVMEAVCCQVAVALERRRLEKALQDLNQLLERRVEERTAQVQETNEQMEAFTYSISHDLRAPLRALRGFAQALNEDYSEALDTTGRDYLRRLEAGAERLDRLIQDLLHYSRLGRSTLTFGPVDLEGTVQRALQQLAPEVRASEASVEVRRPLPQVLGHEPTLEQVVVNLLSNALKFVAPKVPPRIEIWSSQSGQAVRLWVADNGIGIAPAYHQRIFGVFERLHSTESYPGTGIGLAIVAKAITRMGGSYGVESVPDEGSRFWIELPQAPVAEA